MQNKYGTTDSDKASESFFHLLPDAKKGDAQARNTISTALLPVMEAIADSYSRQYGRGFLEHIYYEACLENIAATTLHILDVMDLSRIHSADDFSKYWKGAVYQELGKLYQYARAEKRNARTIELEQAEVSGGRYNRLMAPPEKNWGDISLNTREKIILLTRPIFPKGAEEILNLLFNFPYLSKDHREIAHILGKELDSVRTTIYRMQKVLRARPDIAEQIEQVLGENAAIMPSTEAVGRY